MTHTIMNIEEKCAKSKIELIEVNCCYGYHLLYYLLRDIFKVI